MARPEGDEIVADAISRLNPMLQAALAHPLAKTAPIYYPERRGEVLRPEQLAGCISCIDGINERVVDLWEQVENGGELWNLAGADLMNWVLRHGNPLMACGMLNKVVIALQVFAKTKLREAAKKPSAEPFDEAEFERERDLHRIMENIFAGISFGGYDHR